MSVLGGHVAEEKLITEAERVAVVKRTDAGRVNT